MIDSVLNEYVHTDFHEPRHSQYDNDNPVIVYEPLDNVAEEITLEGEIVLMHHKTPFRMGSRFIVVDSDSVIWGRLMNNQITLCWKRDPGDHYLVVSYDLAGEKEKVDWLQEGF